MFTHGPFLSQRIVTCSPTVYSDLLVEMFMGCVACALANGMKMKIKIAIKEVATIRSKRITDTISCLADSSLLITGSFMRVIGSWLARTHKRPRFLQEPATIKEMQRREWGS